jgi:hypothetical protein
VGSSVILFFFWSFYEDAGSGVIKEDLLEFLFLLLPSAAPIWFSIFTFDHISLNEPIAGPDVIDHPIQGIKKKKKIIGFFTTLCGIITFIDALFIFGMTAYSIISFFKITGHDLHFLVTRLAAFTILFFISFSMAYYPLRMIRKVTYE